MDKYPFVERKLEALRRSIEDVGLWEGVIAREAKSKYEIAFGHHRVEAARLNGLKEIPVIVRPLTDKQMLEFMGRENLEDYNADFLCMLETWEAGVKFLARARDQTTQPLDIAKVLGWISIRGEGRQAGESTLNHTARACNAAHTLILGGYLNRNDLRDMSVSAAQSIVERAHSRMEQLERIGRDTKRPAKEIEKAKTHIAKGAKAAAKDVREGSTSAKEISARVDFHAFKYAKSDEKPTPLFAAFGKILVAQISKTLRSDNMAEKLAEVQKAINMLTLEDDLAIVRQLDFELGELPRRSEAWRKKLIPTDKKVVRLLEVSNAK